MTSQENQEDLASTRFGGDDDYIWEQGLAHAFGEPDPDRGATESLLSRLRARPPSILANASGDAAAAGELAAGEGAGAGAGGGHRYEIADEIGRGGVGRVMRAHDRDLGRDVALKLLRTRQRDPGVVARFLEEARVGGQLEHPGVVPVYDVGVDTSGTPYFAMKLVRGETLAALLKARSAGVDLLRIFHQVCQVVAYAHARGVIHRDLKPANVMVGELGQVHVLDWGFAKVLGSPDLASRAGPAEVDGDLGSSDSSTAPTSLRDQSSDPWSIAGHAFGTPAYMAPEQAAGDVAKVDARTDVFCLGGILCEILTGAPPFAGGNAKERVRRSLEGDLSDAFERLEACAGDPYLVNLCHRCLQADPMGRPEGARFVCDAVGDVFSRATERAQSALVAAAAAESRAAAEKRGRRVVIALASLVVVAVLAGAGGLVHLGAVERQAGIERSVDVGDLLQAARELANGGDLVAAIRSAERARERALAPGPGQLPALVADAETALVSLREDADRQNRRSAVAAVRDDGGLSLLQSDSQYETAFVAYGIDVAEQTAEQIAGRVRAVRDDDGDAASYEVLLAALDDWAARLEGPRVGAGRSRRGPGGRENRLRPPRPNAPPGQDHPGRPEPGARRDGPPPRRSDPPPRRAGEPGERVGPRPRAGEGPGPGPGRGRRPGEPVMPTKDAPGERWRTLVSAAMLADEDPFRVDLRAAILDENVAALKDQVAFLDPASERSASLVLLAMALDRLGEPELGTQVLLSGHSTYPGDYWINFELGRAQLDDPFVTALHARIAVALRPDSYAAWISLGVALLQPGPANAPEDALAVFVRALEVVGGSPLAFQAVAGRAAALDAMGDIEGAIDLALDVEDHVEDLPFDLQDRIERLLERR